MRRLIFGAVLAAVIALVFGVLGEGGGKVQADHTVTITAEANGDLPPLVPPLDCPYINGDFTISLVAANVPPCGDGNNEVTAWTLDFTNEDNFQECFEGVLTSAKLTLTLTPLGVLPGTDTVGISGLGPIPGFPQTFPFGVSSSNAVPLELIPTPYAGTAILGVYTASGGKIPMGYQDDAIVSFARLELTCEAPHVFGDKMYWTDAGTNTNKIQRANLDGTGVVDTDVVDLVTTGLVTPLGIALDRAERKMYWVDGNSADPLQTIERADMLVNPVVGPPVVTGPPPSDRVAIALDLVSDPQKMYWTDFLGTEIKRANLDGSSEELLVNTQCCPVDIALDVGADEMYWTLRFGVDKIQRATLAGNGVTDLLTAADGLIDPRGIALDLVERQMYWVDNGDNTIKRADMAVKPAVTTLVDTDLFVPLFIALDVFDRKMYWTDAGNHTIKRAAMDVNPVVTILVDGPNDGLDIPVGIALDAAPDPGLIRDVVDGLPDSAFKAAPGGKGHKTAMLAQLDEVKVDIENGNIDDAKEGLQDLREHVDGCPPDPDSGDWIVDCDAQLEVRALIDLLLANLGC